MKETVKFEESVTLHNLARAFAGECQDGARYQFLAQQALQEGYNYINTLLKTLAKNEMSHAKTFYDLIINNCKDIKANVDIKAGFPFKSTDNFTTNVKMELENEHMESDSIYPDFARIAKDEGFLEIAKMFERVATVENCHFLQLTQIYEKLKNNSLYKSPQSIKWKCNDCGFEHTAKTPWVICPLCSKEQGYVQIPLDQGKEQQKNNK